MAEQIRYRPKLSFAQANAICREFVPVGDQVFDYMAHLREAGFGAFMPRHEFVGSFAETTDESELHHRCVIEKAKERLGQPTPIRMSNEEVKRIYFSPFLQHLRDHRDKDNGMPFLELRNHYFGGESLWREEVDPCQRKLVQAKIAQKVAFEARWATILEQERRQFEQEAARHATGLGRLPHTFNEPGRYRFFSAVMERDAACMGFEYDKLKSRPNYPIFSKAITDDWDLCWVIEEPRFFFHSPFEGRFAPFLEVRSKNLRGNLRKVQSGEFLNIRYVQVLPGFFNGYWIFFNLDELETVIKAHLYLYGLMASIVEDGIRKGLAADAQS